MPTGWIDFVYNSDHVIKIHSKDVDNNGVMLNEKNPSDNFVLDDGQFHELEPHTKYCTEWLGIPWYCSGKHYKSYSADNTVNFFRSQIGQFDYILFVNDSNGEVLMRQQVPTNCDFHCTMRFENDGVWIDVVHINSALEVDLVREVCNESGEWVKVGASAAMNAVSVFDN